MKLIVSAVVLVFLAAPAMAGEIRIGHFTATIDQEGVVTGGGDGWHDGEWVYYPDTGWYNQWYYNDPPSLDRWKRILCHVELTCPDVSNIIVVAINWSTMDYPASGPNGDPPLDDQTDPPWIDRLPIFTGPVDGSEILDVPHDILEFNPEWVSIDIRQVDDTGSNYPVSVTGWIEHQCVPEPSTLLILGFAALTWAFARRLR